MIRTRMAHPALTNHRGSQKELSGYQKGKQKYLTHHIPLVKIETVLKGGRKERGTNE